LYVLTVIIAEGLELLPYPRDVVDHGSVRNLILKYRLVNQARPFLAVLETGSIALDVQLVQAIDRFHVVLLPNGALRVRLRLQ
jgi:hypothetical protein